MRWRTRWLALLACTVWAFTLSHGVAAAEDEPVCPPGWRDTSVPGVVEVCTHPDHGARKASDAWLIDSLPPPSDTAYWHYTKPHSSPTITDDLLEIRFAAICSSKTTWAWVWTRVGDTEVMVKKWTRVTFDSIGGC